jgi:ABC-type Zn uptake system ZnuABC Zn-binding protein ZnuA
MSRKQSRPFFIFGLLKVTLSILMLSACGSGGHVATSGKLRVLATTSIVADVVAQVGNGAIDLSILMPVGTDPHNGAGLEGFLQPLLESTGATSKLVEVSAGIMLLPLPGGNQPAGDPHTWMNPNNVIIWTQNIATALSTADPPNAIDYQANAERYVASLRELNTWIRSEVAQIPLQNRLLVSDHAVLGYFAAQYGFTQEGTITGSFSSEAAPSARELAALEDKIRQSGVRAVFVSEAVNQTLADQIAADTGIKSIWIYHATLTASGGPAASYLEFMRYNVKAVVEALK